jgi:CheY-like chemotaxis protein
MRILIVDDSPGTRSAFRIGLTSMGYQIATAANGKEALRMLSENVDSDERPDLLLTDLRMPQMNGMELIHTVRKLLPNLPAVLMSAYGDEGIKQKAARLQRCRYLDKPFTAEDLVEVIQAMETS